MRGIGYKAQLQGNNVVLWAGYSHTVTIIPNEGVKVTLPSPTEITVEGIDKQAVGQTAARKICKIHGECFQAGLRTVVDRKLRCPEGIQSPIAIYIACVNACLAVCHLDRNSARDCIGNQAVQPA